MALDWSATSAMLKERYNFDRILKLGWRKYKFFMILRKDFGAGGDQEKIPVDVASVQARSATFSTAQSLAASLSGTRRAFEVTCQENYSLARVTGKMIAATRNNEVAFLKALEGEIDGAYDSILKDTERDLFRDGHGLLAQVASVSTTTLTLANAADAHLFEVGMEVVATTGSGANPRSGSATITAIDRDAGTLESDSNWTSQITGLTANDYLAPQGDFTAANDRKKIYGLEAWCPATAPSAGDSFFGVDRSVDVQRLAGTRYDATTNNENLDEALINAQSEGAMNGALPRICFMSNVNYRKLVNLLGSKKEYGLVPAQGREGPLADIGFKSVKVYGDEGEIDVLSHPYCPIDVAWMFDPDALVFMGMGEYPAIIDDDGQRVLRVYNDNSVEARIGGYPQLATQNPASIVRIKLA